MGLLVLTAGAVVAHAEGIKVGDAAPEFKAETVDGKTLTLADTKGSKVVVITFTCNNCPVAVAYEDRFIEFAKQYEDKGVALVAINVNVTEDLEAMKKRAEEKGFNFPYAYDGSGKSAEAYGARVTPHMYIVDGDGKIAYIGAFDDNMNRDKVTKTYVVDAVDALLAGKRPEVSETKAVGCTIKR
jgi:peroxiredoxin